MARVVKISIRVFIISYRSLKTRRAIEMLQSGSHFFVLSAMVPSMTRINSRDLKLRSSVSSHPGVHSEVEEVIELLDDLAVLVLLAVSDSGGCQGPGVHVGILDPLLFGAVLLNDVDIHQVADVHKLHSGVRSERLSSYFCCDVHDTTVKPVPSDNVLSVPGQNMTFDCLSSCQYRGSLIASSPTNGSPKRLSMMLLSLLI